MEPATVGCILSLAEIFTDKVHSIILAGLSGIIVVEIYTSVMQMEFQNTDNRVGKGFAILGIYLFVVTYCELSLHINNGRTADIFVLADGMLNSTTWLYGSEVLPIALRSKVMGLAAASHFIVNVASTLSHHRKSVG